MVYFTFWLQKGVRGSKGKIWEWKRRVWVTESNTRRDARRKSKFKQGSKTKSIRGNREPKHNQNRERKTSKIRTRRNRKKKRKAEYRT